MCSWEGGVRGNEQKENPNCKAIIKASQRTCGNLSPHQHFIEILGEPLGVGCLQGVGVNLGVRWLPSAESRGDTVVPQQQDNASSSCRMSVCMLKEQRSDTVGELGLVEWKFSKSQAPTYY